MSHTYIPKYTQKVTNILSKIYHVPGSTKFMHLFVPLHLLSLDAVAVALIWQHAFCIAAATKPQPIHRLLLGLCVWGIYLVDRQFDIMQYSKPDTLRHSFHKRHAKLIWCILAAIMITLLGLLVARWHLTTATIAAPLELAGMLIAAITGGYLVVVQFWRQRFPRYLRECVIGTIFAAGCAITALTHAPVDWQSILLLLLVSMLFSLNCLMVESWEHADAPASRRLQLPTATLVMLTLSVSVYLFAQQSVAASYFACASVSGIFLLLLNTRPSSDATHHIAADVALLTPLIPWFITYTFQLVR